MFRGQKEYRGAQAIQEEDQSPQARTHRTVPGSSLAPRLPRRLAWLARLGERIDRRWEESGYHPNRFTPIAAESLRADAWHEYFDEAEVIRWVGAAPRLPLQLDPQARFGEPPVTVWRTNRFVIDIYFWLHPDIAIHDHGFSGAFTNLRGDSLQCTYRFEETGRVSAAARLGRLNPDSVTYLTPGTVQPIITARRFIHRVWHLGCPTVTLVIRTTRQPPRKGTLYFNSGLALRPPETWPVAVDRRRRFVRYLFQRRHPGRWGLAEKMLRSAEPAAAFLYLSEIWQASPGLNDRGAVLLRRGSRPRSRKRAWMTRAIREMQAPDVMHSVNWERLRRTEHRFLIALLSTYSYQQPIADWVTPRYPGRAWQTTVTRWLREMVHDHAIDIELDSMHVAVLDGLMWDSSRRGVLRKLRSRYLLTKSDEQVLRRVMARLPRSFLKPLLTADATIGG